MKLHSVKIFTDENISPKVVAFLRQCGYDILDTKEQQWYGKDDEDLLNIAYQEQRFVLTHDSDFGTLAINEGKPYCGILYLTGIFFAAQSPILNPLILWMFLNDLV
jgi:predicted nuclease of predicted toxin-antitoxin system